MKIKNGFAKREIAGQILVVAVGERATTFNGMITLNKSGSFFWDILANGTTREDLIKSVLDAYDVSRETVETDVDNFINMLREHNLLDD